MEYVLNYNVFGMSIVGWILSFFVSCLASYVVLYLTILKDREVYRKKRINKLNSIKNRMYLVRDWAISIEQNTKNNKSNVLDTKEKILPKEILIIALQLQELEDEYDKIIEILDLIAIIENNCNNKRYLKNQFEYEQLISLLSELQKLSNEIIEEKVAIKLRDLEKMKRRVK